MRGVDGAGDVFWVYGWPAAHQEGSGDDGEQEPRAGMLVGQFYSLIVDRSVVVESK